jgi:hypothetical protein
MLEGQQDVAEDAEKRIRCVTSAFRVRTPGVRSAGAGPSKGGAYDRKIAGRKKQTGTPEMMVVAEVAHVYYYPPVVDRIPATVSTE